MAAGSSTETSEYAQDEYAYLEGTGRSQPQHHPGHPNQPRPQTVAVTWDTSGAGAYGWGRLGANLAREVETHHPTLRVLSLEACGDAASRAVHWTIEARLQAGNEMLMLPFPVVYSLGNDFMQGIDHVTGTVFSSTLNAAIAFIEDADVDLSLTPLYDGPIFTGSSWLDRLVKAEASHVVRRGRGRRQ